MFELEQIIFVHDISSFLRILPKIKFCNRFKIKWNLDHPIMSITVQRIPLSAFWRKDWQLWVESTGITHFSAFLWSSIRRTIHTQAGGYVIIVSSRVSSPRQNWKFSIPYQNSFSPGIFINDFPRQTTFSWIFTQIFEHQSMMPEHR